MEVVEGEPYWSKRSGKKFKVDSVARHGQDCSVTMVVYRNLEPTEDYPANSKWVISETMFLKRFKDSNDDRS